MKTILSGPISGDLRTFISAFKPQAACVCVCRLQILSHQRKILGRHSEFFFLGELFLWLFALCFQWCLVGNTNAKTRVKMQIPMSLACKGMAGFSDAFTVRSFAADHFYCLRQEHASQMTVHCKGEHLSLLRAQNTNPKLVSSECCKLPNSLSFPAEILVLCHLLLFPGCMLSTHPESVVSMLYLGFLPRTICANVRLQNRALNQCELEL